MPVAWYYQRQMSIVSEGHVPKGRRYARFSNDDPGRGSFVMQGFPVDGRVVSGLTVSASIRLDGVRPGTSRHELPVIAVAFFDERRAPLGESVLGPWLGSFDWRDVSAPMRVPPKARHASIRVGLFGATGKLMVDDIVVGPSDRKP
jgi:protein-L-isoaspartate(D-aspartate) O-methyltransferase